MGSVQASEVLTFEVFARSRAPRLGRLAQRILADPHHAEDLVQDVMARVFDRWDRISRLDNPDAYVTRMTVNACTSWWRRAARREQPIDLPAFAELGLAAVPDGAATLAERDRVHRLLARLPARQRAVLVLRYLEDLPDPVIADLLGVREVTVWTNAFHGLGELRRILAASDPDLPFDSGGVVLRGRRDGETRRRRRQVLEAAGGLVLLVLLALGLVRVLPVGSRPPDGPPPTATLEPTLSPTPPTGGPTTGAVTATTPAGTPTGTRTGTGTAGRSGTGTAPPPGATVGGAVVPTSGPATTGTASRTTSRTTGRTTTTTAAPLRAVVGVGASAVGQPGCADASCRWVTLRLTGLVPGAGYDVVPHDDTGLPPPSSRHVTAGPDGTYQVDRLYYFGFPGRSTWVTVGAVESNRLVWPS